MTERTPNFQTQRSFFELYPVDTRAIHEIAAAADLSVQAVYGWVTGRSRVNRDVFDKVILPIMERLYPDIDPDLADEVREQANPGRLRRLRNARVIEVASPQPQPRPTWTPPTPAVQQPSFDLPVFALLAASLRSADLSADQRLALIKILTETHP